MNVIDFNKEEYIAQKKAELDELFQMMNEETERIVFDNGRLRQYLDIQARFNRYSVGNAILISVQNPDTVRMKSFDDWKAENIKVKRGERGIKLLKPIQGEGKIGIYYKVEKLFDVSQTSLNKDNLLHFPQMKLVLKALIHNAPVFIEVVDKIPGGRNAEYLHRDQKLKIRRGLEAEEFFKSVALEVVHAQFAIDNYDYNRGEYECKARAAAYMLCRKYGIEADDFVVVLPDSYREMLHKEVRAGLNEVREIMNEIHERMRDEIQLYKEELQAQERTER